MWYNSFMGAPERNHHFNIEELYQAGLRPGNHIINGETGRRARVIRIIKGARMGYPEIHRMFRGVEVEPPLNSEKTAPTEEILVEDIATRIGSKVYDNLKKVKKAA